MTDLCLKGRLVTGESNIFYVNSDMTISKLKREVMRSIGVQVDQIRLVYGEKLLEDSLKIEFYKMMEGDYFHILTTLVNF